MSAVQPLSSECRCMLDELSLSVGSVWLNSHSVSDPCLPVSGHKDSGTCTDGGQEGLYQFLRPSSSSPPLPRSSPVSMDYSKFGTAASPAIIPEDCDAASVWLQCGGAVTRGWQRVSLLSRWRSEGRPQCCGGCCQSPAWVRASTHTYTCKLGQRTQTGARCVLDTCPGVTGAGAYPS
ncbi:hypothetical protein ABVT39_021339 [Epinephelus coioides]